MTVLHACTRVSFLHQPLLQQAKPCRSLTLHLQFRKQPGCHALGRSSLGCTRLQFGRTSAPSSIAYPGRPCTMSTVALVRVVLILLKTEIRSDGGGCESLHSSFPLFPPPVLVFCFLVASGRARCASLSPCLLFCCKKQECANVTCGRHKDGSHHQCRELPGYQMGRSGGAKQCKRNEVQ